MESLLSLSFDYLTSHNADKIKKGLKQLEGLLAQICLSKGRGSSSSSSNSSITSSTPGHAKRHSVAVIPLGLAQQQTQSLPRELAQLRDDPAFCEFFKLQDGFEWNVTLRLIACLERLLGKSDNLDLVLASTLSLLHGVLLLHPPSRSLFARETNMNLLLDLLYPTSAYSGSCPAVQINALLVLVTALLDHPPCARAFEGLDGLLTVTSVAKDPESSREVKIKCMSFLYFYLMPETPWGWTVADEAGGGSGGVGGGGGDTCIWEDEKAGNSATRSMRDKQRLLAQHISNVDELVEDLMQGQAFGGIMA